MAGDQRYVSHDLAYELHELAAKAFGGGCQIIMHQNCTANSGLTTIEVWACDRMAIQVKDIAHWKAVARARAAIEAVAND